MSRPRVTQHDGWLGTWLLTALPMEVNLAFNCELVYQHHSTSFWTYFCLNLATWPANVTWFCWCREVVCLVGTILVLSVDSWTRSLSEELRGWCRVRLVHGIIRLFARSRESTVKSIGFLGLSNPVLEVVSSVRLAFPGVERLIIFILYTHRSTPDFRRRLTELSTF